MKTLSPDDVALFPVEDRHARSLVQLIKHSLKTGGLDPIDTAKTVLEQTIKYERARCFNGFRDFLDMKLRDPNEIYAPSDMKHTYAELDFFYHSWKAAVASCLAHHVTKPLYAPTAGLWAWLRQRVARFGFWLVRRAGFCQF